MAIAKAGVLGTLLGVLVGCSPTHNWRDVRVGSGALVAVMPCKPDRAERSVPLPGGVSAPLRMASCDVGTTTFAVAELALAPGTDPVATAEAWKTATLASVKRGPDQARPWPLPLRAGWSAQGWRAEGVRHNGAPVAVRVVAATHPQALYQLAVYGEASDEVLAAWWEGMRWADVP